MAILAAFSVLFLGYTILIRNWATPPNANTGPHARPHTACLFPVRTQVGRPRTRHAHHAHKEGGKAEGRGARACQFSA